MGSQLELRSEFPNHLVVYDLWLVGGLEHLAYFPFHIWDVILPIDELNHFSRWLLHHQPDDDLWWFMMIWLFNKRWFLIVKRGCSTGWLDLAIRYQSLAKVIKQTWGWEPAIKKILSRCFSPYTRRWQVGWLSGGPLFHKWMKWLRLQIGRSKTKKDGDESAIPLVLFTWLGKPQLLIGKSSN